jgi:hypothetical protein
MGNYTYLPQFPIHTATTMLPVKILLLYKKRFAKSIEFNSFFYNY